MSTFSNFETNIATYKNKRFWFCFFIPIFVAFLAGSLLYSFVYIKDTYRSDASYALDSSLAPDSYEHTANVIESASLAEDVSTLLLGKKVFHGNGASIADEEIKQGIVADYSIELYSFAISFTSSDSSITKEVLEAVLSEGLIKISSLYPTLNDKVKILDHASDPIKVDTYRYQYISMGCIAGLVLSISSYSLYSQWKKTHISKKEIAL
jgi:hypothetical protein